MHRRGVPIPPRRPLRVRVTGQLPQPDGGTLYSNRWRVIAPDEVGYEAIYKQAVAAYRANGTPMPYAGAQESTAGETDT